MSSSPEVPPSYWTQHARVQRYPTVAASAETYDVIIVGGGVAGLTTAYLLKEAGKRVALIEAAEIGSGQTAQTTAQLSWVVDQPITTLASDFGDPQAKVVLDALSNALDEIERIIHLEHIDCGFARVGAYRFGRRVRDREGLEADAKKAFALGRAATYVAPRQLAVVAPGGAMFAPDQVEIDPVPYCVALAERIDGGGSSVFEGSRVTESKQVDGVWEAHVGDTKVRGLHLITASGSPFGLATLLQTRLEAYQTYAIAVKVPKNTLAAGFYWDCDEPYHYTRTVRRSDHDIIICGGCDHRTGEVEDTYAPYGELEAYVRGALHVPRFDVLSAWSGQVLETVDGVPYIGAFPAGGKNHWVATGFGGNGMAYGVVTAMVLRDCLLGRSNPAIDAFDPTRTKILASAGELVKNSANVAWQLARGRLSLGDEASLDEVKPGEGKVLRVQGRKLAVYRDEQGVMSAMSPICSHMGCVVTWNPSETTWDCPCHGSRFAANGEVQTGPVMHALRRVALIPPAAEVDPVTEPMVVPLVT